MIKVLTIILFSFVTSHAWGQIQGLPRVETANLTIGPVMGFERVQKLRPTPRTKTRFFYGLRALYGVPLLSAEAEVTRATDNEFFPLDDLRLNEESITAMLGVRSTYALQTWLNAFLRAGGHYRQTKIKSTQAGVTNEETLPRNLSPYAGTGVDIHLARFFSLNAGITAIFLSSSFKSEDIEYQTTLGFTIRF